MRETCETAKLDSVNKHSLFSCAASSQAGNKAPSVSQRRRHLHRCLRVVFANSSVLTVISRAPRLPSERSLCAQSICAPPVPHQAIFFGGIDPSIRGEVWPFLLLYYSYDSTSEEREAWRLQKRAHYHDIQQRRWASKTPPVRSEYDSVVVENI